MRTTGRGPIGRAARQVESLADTRSPPHLHHARRSCSRLRRFELIERVRHGDRDALERLVARHVGPLRRWVSGRLPRAARDLADTDYLVQDTLLRTFTKIEGFEPRGSAASGRLRRWLTAADGKRPPSGLSTALGYIARVPGGVAPALILRDRSGASRVRVTRIVSLPRKCDILASMSRPCSRACSSASVTFGFSMSPSLEADIEHIVIVSEVETARRSARR